MDYQQIFEQQLNRSQFQLPEQYRGIHPTAAAQLIRTGVVSAPEGVRSAATDLISNVVPESTVPAAIVGDDPEMQGIASVYEPKSDVGGINTSQLESGIVSTLEEGATPDTRSLTEQYGLETSDYDEWDWLRDVGFGMMSNEETTLLGSFGAAALDASRTSREVSSANRKLENELRIAKIKAESEAATEAQKQKVAALKEKRKLDRENNTRAVNRLDKFLKPDMMEGIFNSVASKEGFASYAYDEEASEAMAKSLEVLMDEDASLDDKRSADLTLKNLFTSARGTGQWAELTDDEKQTVLRSTYDRVFDKLKNDPDANISKVFNEEAVASLHAVNWELPGSAKTDLRFSTPAYTVMKNDVDDLVGEGFFNISEASVAAALKDGILSKSQFELLEEKPAQLQKFYNDTAAKIQEIADMRGVAPTELPEDEVRQIGVAAIFAIGGGIDKFGPYNQAPQVSSFDEFYPEDTRITQYLNNMAA